MKNTTYLLAFVILLCVTGCKKQESDPCLGILCQNGGTCVNGHCICINDFTGTKCEIAPDTCLHVNCGPHGNCVNGNCECDYNWTGIHCDQQIAPIDTFIASYHMVGFTQSQIPDTAGILPPPVPEEDTIIVTKFNDITLLINGYNHTYQNIFTDYYSYEWLSSTSGNYAILSFKKALDDSAFYEVQSGSNMIYLKGKKIQ